MNCFTCGGFGYVSAQCPTDFQGMCHLCGQWGHPSRFCSVQHAQVSMDEYERAQDGYAYNPNSEYYQTYAEAYAKESASKRLRNQEWEMTKFKASLVS